MESESKYLEKLAFMKMPFGRFKDVYLSDLPDAYLVWFRQNGFPKGELGRMLAEMQEIKMNGLEQLLRNIRNAKVR